ncbi:MAG TPA: hypothetical protein VNW98_01465 [Burkholderiaceae bacterium]|jgi:hypothetical protein|nr:hypothetical protein [Burkholderiaceae bacterium]
MSLYVVDVEADGPAPGLWSMVCFGAVALTMEDGIYAKFKAFTAPISADWQPDALAVSGFTREEHSKFPEAPRAMFDFRDWIARTNRGDRATFVSDNPAFDWQFINWYFWKFVGENPFGHSGRRIGDFAAGLAGDFFGGGYWRKLRKSKHDHDPLNDASGVAEALLELVKQGHIKPRE